MSMVIIAVKTETGSYLMTMITMITVFLHIGIDNHDNYESIATSIMYCHIPGYAIMVLK